MLFDLGLDNNNNDMIIVEAQTRTVRRAFVLRVKKKDSASVCQQEGSAGGCFLLRPLRELGGTVRLKATREPGFWVAGERRGSRRRALGSGMNWHLFCMQSLCGMWFSAGNTFQMPRSGSWAEHQCPLCRQALVGLLSKPLVGIY